MWEYRASLSPATGAVHDGDTVRLLIDLGFDVRADKWIRLADVAAPELSQPGGRQAREFVRGWLVRRVLTDSPTGRAVSLRWPFRLVTEVTKRPEPEEVTTFARYVGRVYDMTGACLNDDVRAYLTGDLR
jgi:hypothetical protein